MTEPAPRAIRGSRKGWAQISVKIPHMLHRRLHAAAAAANRTLTDEVVARLEASLRHRDEAAN